VSTLEAYDRLAPHYRAYSESRAAYLGAVDRFVVTHAVRGGRMLDVGSGDGVRALAIARAIEASRLILCEPSTNMAALCRAHAVAAVWTAPAQSLPETDERFEVVTCLWNVLGHLPDRAARIAALSSMRRLTAPGGRIFCDVNNRHNARAYGPARVWTRRLIDALVPDERRGYSQFTWKVGADRIPAWGYLFTPHEMDGLIAAAGLAIEQRIAIDYMTGKASVRPWDGQLLYCLRAPAAVSEMK
jgi:ubiquinone/menaquinone biosynthesis C-methylase UbiE